MNLTDDIKTIKGIGDKTALLFSKASVFCINDLIHYFPRNYVQTPDISRVCDCNNGEYVAVLVKISSNAALFKSGAKQVLSFTASDGTDILRVYYFGMPYLKKEMTLGRELLLIGTVNYTSKGKAISNPKIVSKEEYQSLKGILTPVYPLIKGLTNNIVIKAINQVKDSISFIKEYLPKDIIEKYNLPDVANSLYMLHFPKSMEDVYEARRRIAFDEFLFFLIKLSLLKDKNVKLENRFKLKANVNDLIDNLPYELTNAQTRAVNDVLADISSDYLMNRLIQGDVGSGKTIVSFAAAYSMIQNNYQVALMAPTQVLANQHYLDICNLENDLSLGFKPILLSGSLTAKEKRLAKEGIKDGTYNFIIGTNAIITDDVEYNNLAMAITDEQHRFGVRQRLSLMNKGDNVHVLVMSATPIPRTLGLILYGDLDVTVIDELPASRLPIKNSVIGPQYRPKVYEFIKKQVNEGRQAYVICPMVEEGELENVNNVTDYAKDLKNILPPSFNIGILHGKMKNKEKDEVMDLFKAGNIDVLVSTTVVEVGVNVPNATVILIENAERFGLAQLHQLRGRVGRGGHQSYCMFLTGNDSKKAMDRLSILGKTNDGFKVASEDLKQRGPGDFFGLRQSGMPMFRFADIYTDSAVLQDAKNAMEEIADRGALNTIVSKENSSFIDFHLICL